MAPNYLPYLPSKLLAETADWSFDATLKSSMGSLLKQGQGLMQPVREQVTEVVRQALPAPAPAPTPEPMRMPEVTPFTLPSLESWGMHAPEPPRAPQQPIDLNPTPQTAPSPPQGPPGAAGALSGLTQGFSLPSLASWGIGSGARPGTPTPAPGGMGAPLPGAAAAPTARPADVRIDRSSPTAFLGSFRPAAEAALAAKGYPTSLAPILAAIPMNEQGWQKDAPGQNYYGIKGSNPRTGANTGPVGTWEDYGGGRTNIQDTFRAYGSPTESVQDFLQFLEENPRYKQAVEVGKRTGDPSQFIKAIHAAGYATDPAWSDRILSIASTVPAGTPDAPAPASPAPRPGTYTKDPTPNQITEGAAQGLSAEEALAVCGPAAAVAFARANGRNPSLREAKELAQNLGLWDVSQGMHGPASQVQLLQKLGVQARLQEGTDWTRVAQEVQSGRPVIVDSPSHYYVASAFYPETGEFEFGQSAGVLRAAKGRTRFKPADLPSLGMGSPRATIYLTGGG